MAKKISTTHPSVFAEYTKEGPVVAISKFENLSPVKIERCFEAILREWYRLRAVSIHERKKREREAEAQRIGAENG